MFANEEVQGNLGVNGNRYLFKIIRKKEGLPVYEIENINKKDDVRVVHRNLLKE